MDLTLDTLMNQIITGSEKMITTRNSSNPSLASNFKNQPIDNRKNGGHCDDHPAEHPFSNPVRIFWVVLLTAPDGPKNPNISPGRISNVRFLAAKYWLQG
jgi:hypothetical protein